MRLWFDTEFIEAGPNHPLELLSIGVVAEDGREFYAEVRNPQTRLANDWVKANVLPHLQGGDALMWRRDIARAIRDFAGIRPEWWAYYADYDWVLLCQLYGAMATLPTGWPMFALDIKQLAVSRGNPALPAHCVECDGPEHHALSDAHWNRRAFEHLLTFGEVMDYPARP